MPLDRLTAIVTYVQPSGSGTLGPVTVVGKPPDAAM